MLCLLAPHLAPENADELIAAATHQTRAGIERLLADRFPRPEAYWLEATGQAEALQRPCHLLGYGKA